MHDPFLPIAVLALLFIGLPWLVLHYITQWKTAATLTTDDEQLLGELYQLARRLEERVDTVERLVASDDVPFQPRRVSSDKDFDRPALDQLDKLLARREDRT